MKFTVRFLLVAVAALALFVGAGCGDDDDDDDSPTDAPTAAATGGATTAAASPTPIETETLTYGIASRSAAYWLLYIGMAEGMFADNGVEIDLVVGEGGASATTQLLTSGAVDMAGVATDPPLAAISQGAEVVFVDMFRPQIWSLVTPGDITTYEQLKAAQPNVSGSSPNTGSGLILKLHLEEHGLTEDDYDIVEFGSSSDRLNALQAGQVKAGALSSPSDIIAVQNGYNVLGTTYDVAPFYQTGDIVNRSFVESDCGLLTRYFAGLTAALAWFVDPANRDKAVEILIDEAGVDQDIAEANYDSYQTQPELGFALIDPTEAVEGTIALLEQIGSLEPGEVTPADAVSTECTLDA